MAVMDTRAGAPERSLVQRMDALAKANRVRSYRADLKVRLAAGECGAVDVLLDPVEQVESMKVFDLLLAIPKFGRVKVNQMLTRNRISPSKTVGGLSERQRRELADHLRAYGRRPRRVL